MSLEASHEIPETVAVLTLQQAGDLLGCSKTHVWRLIKGGLIPTVDLSATGNQRMMTRILLDDLNDYIRYIRAAGRTEQVERRQLERETE